MRAGSEVVQGFANERKERECAQMVKHGLFAGEVYERKQRECAQVVRWCRGSRMGARNENVRRW